MRDCAAINLIALWLGYDIEPNTKGHELGVPEDVVTTTLHILSQDAFKRVQPDPLELDSAQAEKVWEMKAGA